MTRSMIWEGVRFARVSLVRVVFMCVGVVG